mmetsp:Transcript_3641/g.7017  ORF Transcript_3641/g.7017 Transcript_3641/m.7017 type:complete len:239 (-) Transcript_3641:379-1095(-)
MFALVFPFCILKTTIILVMKLHEPLHLLIPIFSKFVEQAKIAHIGQVHEQLDDARQHVLLRGLYLLLETLGDFPPCHKGFEDRLESGTFYRFFAVGHAIGDRIIQNFQRRGLGIPFLANHCDHQLQSVRLCERELIGLLGTQCRHYAIEQVLYELHLVETLRISLTIRRDTAHQPLQPLLLGKRLHRLPAGEQKHRKNFGRIQLIFVKNALSQALQQPIHQLRFRRELHCRHLRRHFH